jgi:alanyl-tRNA synthetase
MKASEIRANSWTSSGTGTRGPPALPWFPPTTRRSCSPTPGWCQFKQVFLGREGSGTPGGDGAEVRAGRGKHNDLEQVGETARHHTFFEMLGNFSFGDYFKEDAVRFAWDFLTEDLGLDPERIFVTVHHTDDEAHDLWRDGRWGCPRRGSSGWGDRDNFWQMADTGPCGPCSELHYDLRPEGSGARRTRDLRAAGGGRGLHRALEPGLHAVRPGRVGGAAPPPAPSIDTGAGLERLAAVLQGADSNYHTDLFRPFWRGWPRWWGGPTGRGPEGLSYRVLADHARAVAFLLADGVFPSNEGRGYVLRRILRRGVRHAWLLGRREPTLVRVVERVIDTMAEAYPSWFGPGAPARNHPERGGALPRHHRGRHEPLRRAGPAGCRWRGGEAGP